jgi:hypothetical protein
MVTGLPALDQQINSSMQLLYFASAAEALSSVQGEIEELSVAAEGDYR